MILNGIPKPSRSRACCCFAGMRRCFLPIKASFGARLQRHIAQAKRPIRCVVLAAEPITDVDTTAAEMLGELEQWLQQRGILLYFAEMKGQ